MGTSITWLLGILLIISVCGATNLGDKCVEQDFNENAAEYILLLSESPRVTQLAVEATAQFNNETNSTLGLRILPSGCPEIQVNYLLWKLSSHQCEGNSTSQLIGVIGPDGEKFKHALGNNKIPYTVVEKAASIVERAKAIAKLAVDWNWDYTTILCGDDEESVSLLPPLQSQLVENSVCYKQVNFTSKNLSNAVRAAEDSNKPTGVIVLGNVAQADLTSFTNNRTWIISSSSFPCLKSFSGASSVFALHSDKSVSSNTAYSSQFMSALNLTVKAYNSALKQNDDSPSKHNISPLSLSLMNSTNSTVATYNGNWSFTRNDYSEGRESWCIDKACRQKCSKQNPPRNFIFVDGDYILVVTAPIHDTFLAYPDLYTCTQFNKEAAIRTQAALHARDRLENLTNINFGLLVLDTCFNEALAQKYMADILSGNTPYCYKGQCLNRTKIVGVIGDLVSHVAVAEQRMLMPAGLLQVSYGSATDILDDKTEFTNFLRVHNGNRRVIENIVQVLNYLKAEQEAEINSVVIIHTDTGYGLSGRRQLEKILKEHNYCTSNLAINIPFKLNYTAQYEDVEGDYTKFWEVLSKTVKTSMVFVYIGEEKAIRDLLKPLKDNEGLERWWKESGSIFIMAEIWEDRQSLLKDYNCLLRGSLSFKMLPNFEVKGFKTRLRKKLPNALDIDQTFNQLFEEQKLCKIRGSFRTNHNNSCDGNGLKISDSSSGNGEDELTVDIYTTNLIKAMYAFGYGLQMFNTHSSEKDYGYLRRNNQQLKGNIENVRIPPNDNVSIINDAPIFDCNLDGTGGYEVFSQQYNGGKVVYEKVFTFEKQAYGKQDLLKPTSSKAVFYKFKNNQNVAQNSLKANHCRNDCPCPTSAPASAPASAPSTLIILLATALSVVSVILIVMMLRCVWKKVGSRVKLPYRKKRLADNNADNQSPIEMCQIGGTMPNNRGLVEGGSFAEESENEISHVHPDGSFSLHMNTGSRSPSLDTGCDCSELQLEDDTNCFVELAKPQPLGVPPSIMAQIRPPVPRPRIHTVSSSTE